MSYQFVPWVKGGTGAAAVQEDLSEAVPSRSVLPVLLRINDRHDAPIKVRLFGPGDVTGIDQRQIVRVEPRPLTVGFEPNYFPAVEFRRPDFPWIFTPATGDARGRLRPWLCLVVVRVQEGVQLTAARNRPLPSLMIVPPAQPSMELPDLAESWAWAHTQVIGQAQGSELEELLKGDTMRAISRLLCPVKLTATTRYYACVVPTFEAGRKAGLGLEAGPEDEQLTPAWRSGGDASPSVELPVYFHWEFTTGSGGDFEKLVRRLTGGPVSAGVGARDMEVANLGFGLPDLGRITFEGALGSPKLSETAADPEKLTEFGQQFRGILNATAPLDDNTDPVVGPPIYGQYHTAVQQAPAKGETPVWIGELNLEPRHRAAAGLGTLVVQDQQEHLMASAWEQLAGAPSAVQAMRQAALAREVGRKILTKHLAALDSAQLLELTTPVHARVRFTVQGRALRAAPGTGSTDTRRVAALPTMDARLRESTLPRGATTAVFRRTLRSGGPITRRVARAAPAAAADPRRTVMSRLVERMVIPPKPIIPILIVRGFVTTEQVGLQLDRLRELLASSVEPPAEANRFREAGELLQAYLEKTVPSSPPARLAPPPPPPPLREAKEVLLAQLNPDETVTARLQARLNFPASASARAARDSDAAAEPSAVMPHPEFPQPMYEALREMSQEFLLPGAENVAADTVTLVKTNPQFVESFMIGLNHEMSRELLWREYPTDQRGTYFTRFWDIGGGSSPQAQMPSIQLWNPNAPLGRTFMGDGFEGRLVLLIRGEVLRRYPGTVIYATREDRLNVAGEELYPVFRGALEPDTVFLGFDLTESEARGDDGTSGYYFILQEQPAEPRFGLDVPSQFGADPQTLTSWSDLTWGHVVADAAAFDRLTHVPLGGRLDKKPLENAEWGLNSADMARITLQQQVRVAMHASELLPART